MANDAAARVRELTGAFRTAIDVGAAHLQAAVAADDDGERAELVELARGELALAETMLNERRKLLEPLSVQDEISDRNVRESLAKLHSIADETSPSAWSRPATPSDAP